MSSSSEESSKVETIIDTNDFEFQNPTFVNFTADWCITCKVNEARVLKSSTVLEYLDTNKIDYIVTIGLKGMKIFQLFLKVMEEAVFLCIYYLKRYQPL